MKVINFLNRYFIPEIYLLILTIWYWIDLSRLLNPIAIVFSATLLFLIWKKKKIVGVIFSSLIFLLTFYLVLAFLSDFYKIEQFDQQAKDFVIYGMLFLTFNFVASLLMLYKYASDKFTIQHAI